MPVLTTDSENSIRGFSKFLKRVTEFIMSVLGIFSLVLVGLLGSSKLGFCAAKYNVCPVGNEKSIHDVFGASGYLQKGIWHRINCPTFRPTESLSGVSWYHGSSVDDPSTVRLISRDLRGGDVKDSPADERYSMSSNHGLVIEGVDDRDEGSFLCQVVPQASDIRVGKVYVQVTGTNIEDVFSASAYVQKSIWHRIPCPTFRPTESLDGVIWYQGSSADDPSTVRLISRDLRGSVIKDSPADERYSMTSNHGLVIEGVEDRDEGSFLCQVIPKATDIRVGRVYVQVIGDTFPRGSSQTSSKASFYRGRRQTLSCECASQTPDAPISVVYWSTGEGVTTDTQIIGARFSDGATLKVGHGADYSIGSDDSLIVNSLNDVQDTQRFWCHVFQLDGTLRNFDVVVQISDQETPNHALKASSTSFYLLEGGEQTLPCSSWTPGVATCEPVQWFKNDTSGRHFLLSSNDVDAESEFDLASDFGLIVKSVDSKDAGRYQCDTGGGIGGDNIAVRVIDENFPLDGGRLFASSKIDLKAGENYTLPCQAALNLTESGSPATVFWSFANPDNLTTTNVIGRLNLPGRSKTMYDLGDIDCFSISQEGALLLNMCFQAAGVRFWCHVFPENELLIRSYVDVLTKEPQPAAFAELPTFYIIIAVCCCLVLIVAGVFVVGKCVRLKRRRGNVYLPVAVTMPVIPTDPESQSNALEKETSSKGQQQDHQPTDRPGQ